MSFRTPPPSDPSYRIPVTLFLSADQADSQSDVVECWAHELSPSGLTVILNRQIPQQHLLVFLEVADEDSIFRTAQVVRSKQLGSTAWEYGLCFEGRNGNASAPHAAHDQSAVT
ncbi:MAG: PilZ domain-containing protein [Planctomycetales bacterium]